MFLCWLFLFVQKLGCKLRLRMGLADWIFPKVTCHFICFFIGLSIVFLCTEVWLKTKVTDGSETFVCLSMYLSPYWIVSFIVFLCSLVLLETKVIDHMDLNSSICRIVWFCLGNWLLIRLFVICFSLVHPVFFIIFIIIYLPY